MTALVVNIFSGLAPRLADRLLDASQASFAANLKITNGNIRGFRNLKLHAQFTPAGTVYRRAIKIYKVNSDEFTWLLSLDPLMSAVENPLASDAFHRVYFTDNTSTGLRVTTYDQLVIDHGASSQPSGVPRPTVAPTVTPAAGTADIRAYIYGYADQYGAIGPPSPPTIATGAVTGTWTISGFGAAPANAVKRIIYRSAAGEQTSGAYYKVGEQASTATSFADAMANDLVPLQPIMDTQNNDPAPVDIQGLVQHSSGAIAGFVDRTVYFSVPYLPHAWPQIYAYTVDDTIVGLAAISNWIVVITKGTPVILSGNGPDSIGINKMADPEPCLSRRSIVVMSNAVFYASPNGLTAISTNGMDRPLVALFTSEEWAHYNPDNIVAARYGSYYVGFFDSSNGFSVGLPPYEPISFMPLNRYAQVTGVEADERTGDLLVLQSDKIQLFDHTDDTRFPTTWRSKEWITPKPINFGAYQILFRTAANADSLKALTDAMTQYNEDRFAAGPLDVIDMYPIGGQFIFPANPDPVLAGLPPIQPIGGEPLYDLSTIFGTGSMRMTFIADDAVVYSNIVTDELVHNLPEGYKSTRHYIEVSGSAQVQRIVVAETRRECKKA